MLRRGRPEAAGHRAEAQRRDRSEVGGVEHARAHERLQLVGRGVPVLRPAAQRARLDHRHAVAPQLQRAREDQTERAAAHGDVHVDDGRARRSPALQHAHELGRLRGRPAPAVQPPQGGVLRREAVEERRATSATRLRQGRGQRGERACCERAGRPHARSREVGETGEAPARRARKNDTNDDRDATDHDQGKPGEPGHRNIGRGSCRSALADANRY